jgi:hypothetical protein
MLNSTDLKTTYAELISACGIVGFIGKDFAGSQQDLSDSWKFFLEFLQETKALDEMALIQDAFYESGKGEMILLKSLNKMFDKNLVLELNALGIEFESRNIVTAKKNASILLEFLNNADYNDF